MWVRAACVFAVAVVVRGSGSSRLTSPLARYVPRAGVRRAPSGGPLPPIPATPDADGRPPAPLRLVSSYARPPSPSYGLVCLPNLLNAPYTHREAMPPLSSFMLHSCLVHFTQLSVHFI